MTLEGYAASPVAVAALQEDDGLLADLAGRTNTDLHNLIEQDHRRVKQRVRPRLGVTCFTQATGTISGSELGPQSKKAQFALSVLCGPPARCRSGRQYGLREQSVE